jgi:RNA polymerase sigma factor (sigma-70 family)
VTDPRLPLPPAFVDVLFRKAGAARWGLAREQFEHLLHASLRHAFPATQPSARDVQRYLDGVHVSDLALAGACAHGSDAAWDHFILEHRPGLYRAADALDPAGGARELADSLYADLYGIRTGREGRSLFNYFHGRSSLATWLRAVLSQRYVDAIRARRRLEPLTEDDGLSGVVKTQAPDPDRSTLVPLVDRALREAIDALPDRERLRLRSYHVAGLTLAQIGRMTGEHEATVSRQLARTRREVRQAAERWLRDTGALGEAQIARALELAIEDPGELDLQQVFDRPGDRKESP